MSERQALVGNSAPHHEQRRDTDVMGMWIFLGTEVLFFGVLFTGYAVYRALHPAAFAEASRHLNATLGAANTAILLTSSFFVALAIWAARRDKRRLLLTFLLLTMMLGLAFLGLKGFEYFQEFQENLLPLPWLTFAYEGQYPQQGRLFFNLYLTMTGFHALHLLIGVLLLGLFSLLAWRGFFRKGHTLPLELLGLYWHFVDVVWVFFFPLLYLIDRT